MQDLQDLHLAPGAVERALGWWRRFGGRQAFLLVLAVSMPLIRFEYLPHMLSTTVETLAEGYGMDLKVGEWDGSLTDIKVIAKDVEITTGGPYSEKRLFRAHSVEFDWSLVRAISGGLSRVGSCWTAIFGRECTVPEEIFHKVVIDGATLHIERSLAGAWNTEDAFRVKSLDELRRVVRRWQIPSIEGHDLSVSWVEQLAGDSGGGLVENRTSSLDFTKVVITVADLQVPVDSRENPTHFTFDGQTADGQVSVKAEVNLSRWDRDTWAPSSDVTYRLVNVGAASFGRFAAPNATLVPRTGRVDGTIRVAHEGDALTACDIQMQLRDVTYGANPRSPFAQIGGERLVEEVKAVRISQVVSTRCDELDGRPRPDLRPAERMQTLVTGAALETAPPIVRSAAGYDTAAVVEGRTFTRAELTTQVSEQLGKSLGGEKGAAVAKALTAPDDGGGNVVTRGARGIGRGFKKLFGGGGNKPAKPAKKP